MFQNNCIHCWSIASLLPQGNSMTLPSWPLHQRMSLSGLRHRFMRSVQNSYWRSLVRFGRFHQLFFASNHTFWQQTTLILSPRHSKSDGFVFGHVSLGGPRRTQHRNASSVRCKDICGVRISIVNSLVSFGHVI